MVCHCSVVRNWQLTPRSCPRFEVMGCLADSAQTRMARHLLRPVDARSAPSPSWLVTDELAEWSSRPHVHEPISEGQGQVCAACLGWAGPPGLAPPLGFSPGVCECPRRLHCPGCTAALLWVPTEWFLPLLLLSQIAATCRPQSSEDQ